MYVMYMFRDITLSMHMHMFHVWQVLGPLQKMVQNIIIGQNFIINGAKIIDILLKMWKDKKFNEMGPSLIRKGAN